MNDSREDCVLESAGRVLRQLSPVRQKHALIKLIENGEHHDLLALAYPDAARLEAMSMLLCLTTSSWNYGSWSTKSSGYDDWSLCFYHQRKTQHGRLHMQPLRC